MTELNGNTPGELAIREGGPLADSIKDLENYGKIAYEREGQEALNGALGRAAGLPEEHGDYFID